MRRLPTLTAAQRRALLVLEWLLLLGIIAFSFWKSKDGKVEVAATREWNGAPVRPFTYAEKEREVETFPFDPNTADSTTLLRLGLSPWQVRSIYRYRAKLGRYHTPEDFMRVPNMTVEQWNRLKPFVRIAPQFRYVEPPSRKSYPTEEPRIVYAEAQEQKAVPDTFPKQEKIENGQTIDVSTADTSLLKQIPGIASKRAARIVAYRNALGGFVSAEQAMEAVEMPDSVLKYMTASPQPLRQINLNRLSVQQMMKHPYISFYQAKAIFEHRRNKGPLHSIEELERLGEFKPTDIDRLRPYVVFE